MAIPLFHVDAFTEQPFGGNPAAVCLLSEPKEDAWLQAVAREMNLSETAFLLGLEQDFRLRWFTPAVEVELCGHATLASAHILWQEGHARPEEPIRLHTMSGVLTATRRGADIELEFPLNPEEPIALPEGMEQALGATPAYVGKSRFDYLVELDSEETVRRLTPNFPLLAALPVRGVIVTSRSADPRFDFVSRFFAPGSGVDEDPVTGSAHCCLGPFWQKRLNKDEFVAYQASARGGVVRVRVGEKRAYLAGKAVTIAKGDLVV
jgi:PhzF family phenazine biosynthesis protein